MCGWQTRAACVNPCCTTPPFIWHTGASGVCASVGVTLPAIRPCSACQCRVVIRAAPASVGHRRTMPHLRCQLVHCRHQVKIDLRLSEQGRGQERCASMVGRHAASSRYIQLSSRAALFGQVQLIYILPVPPRAKVPRNTAQLLPFPLPIFSTPWRGRLLPGGCLTGPRPWWAAHQGTEPAAFNTTMMRMSHAL